MTAQRLLAIVGGLSLLAWAAPAHAADVPVLTEIFKDFQSITDQVTDHINTALGLPSIGQIVHVLFSALALGLFVWRFAGFALRGFDLLDILELMLTIFFVYILLRSYREIFPAIFGAGRHVADLIASALIGVDSKKSLAESIFGLLFNFSFEPSCSGTDCVGSGILSIVAAIVTYVAIIVLGIIAALVELWTVWGFQIAFAVGWVTIPLLLYERLAFVFDGWLKFFFGMLIFTLVAKVNLALVLLGLQMVSGNNGQKKIQVDGFFDVLGILVFVVVGIYTLFCTERFASTIVSSAGAGGDDCPDRSRWAAGSPKMITIRHRGKDLTIVVLHQIHATIVVDVGELFIA